MVKMSLLKSTLILLSAGFLPAAVEAASRPNIVFIFADDMGYELFNLPEDTSQRENLYAEYPERVKQMKTLLERYRSEPRNTAYRNREGDDR